MAETLMVNTDEVLWLHDERVKVCVSGDLLTLIAFGGYGRDDEGDLVEIETFYEIHRQTLTDAEQAALEDEGYPLMLSDETLEAFAQYRALYPLE